MGLDDSKNIKNNFVSYSDVPIIRIHPFNILYKEFGHIWFLSVYVNFPKFQCEYINFEKKLFGEYEKLFGKSIMSGFPVYDKIICDYVEFFNIFNMNNVDDIINNARILGCSPVKLNLDINDLSKSKKTHGKFDFCVSKKDKNHIETLVSCFGTALKKRIKDKSLHGPVGIKVSKIMDKGTEKEIVEWVLKKNNFKLIE